MIHENIKGLIAAVHTPVHEDYSLNLDCVKMQADHLIKSGVTSVYVSGTTGEGQLFDAEERIKLFQEWGIIAKDNSLQFIAHIGHRNQSEATNLALAARDAGAQILSSMSPPNTNISRPKELVEWLKPVLMDVSDIPFYFYDTPKISGAEIDMEEFLKLAVHELPSLVGLKFNNTDLSMLERCMNIEHEKFDILYGVDEMLILGMDQGCKGAVGSTYNFAAPIYHRLIEAYEVGDRNEADKLQNFSIQFIDIIGKYDFLPAAKMLMKSFGIDCGPARPPNRQLSENEFESLHHELDQINFFDIINKS
ncbi:MAG: hypothetical protein CMG75_06575 [Candidatus Marinimicrobia bacterium]|nr:hypothetical protein [Candidatus Neomarinimicrobiota bacterium]